MTEAMSVMEELTSAIIRTIFSCSRVRLDVGLGPPRRDMSINVVGNRPDEPLIDEDGKESGLGTSSGSTGMSPILKASFERGRTRAPTPNFGTPKSWVSTE
ncbi:hypothetical protein H072_2605 [Dactylellina haptotyla CBS 200.50]|uniref:Uncharacterized protein n=1 Tax=Dactylellina haptotyla (strain CBS 200.50) TaxID=1284197 RepID=S8BVC5_DACHA|nr:hypothetical protein H072_2605 [Dactylellina haptotyla CBS 200.50]